jgi:16S rRNA (uracil1498-N3)-methyltransferase
MPEPALHHVAHVLRRGVGDDLLVFNGRDGEFRAEIATLTRKDATLRIGARIRQQSSPRDLTLCFAPLKKDATDFVIEKGTELGVSRFQPVTTRLCVATRVNAERLRQNAILAAQQSERLSVPEFAPVLSLERMLADWPGECLLLVCAERGKAEPIGDVLATFTRIVTPPNRWAILCGPEGGFDAGELDRIAELPFARLVGLGPRVLRADTAALAALAVFQMILGDGALRPPERPDATLTRHGQI